MCGVVRWCVGTYIHRDGREREGETTKNNRVWKLVRKNARESKRQEDRENKRNARGTEEDTGVGFQSHFTRSKKQAPAMPSQKERCTKKGGEVKKESLDVCS